MNTSTKVSGTKTMKAIDVACILLFEGDKIGRQLTNLDIQKLVYFAHGWHLALSDSPLIDEEVQAWKHGPVIPSLYNQFKTYGFDPIPSSKVKRMCSDITTLDQTEVSFVQAVFSVYKRYSTFELVRLTHAGETPWDRVIKEYGNARNVVIPDEYMREFFKARVRK